MACEANIDVQFLGEGKLRAKGTCTGKDCKDPLGCLAEFSLPPSNPRNPRRNKNAKITGQGSGGSQANIEVSTDGDDIDEGVLQLSCTCGKELSGTPAEYSFMLVHPIGVKEVLEAIVTLGKFWKHF